MSIENKNKIGKLNYIKSTNIFAFKNFINFLIAGNENCIIKAKKKDFKYFFYIDKQYLNEKSNAILQKLSEHYNNQLVFISID